MAEAPKRPRRDSDDDVQILPMDQDQDTQGSYESSENEIFGPSPERPRPVTRRRIPPPAAPVAAPPPVSQYPHQGPPDVEIDWANQTVTLTAYEVLARVEKAWLNEKLCTELLVPLVEETDCMQEQLRILEQNFSILSKRDMRLPIHQMEGERIRYLLTSYFRCRLKKIQKFPWFIKNQELTRPVMKKSRLTQQEKKFLHEYVNNLEAHLNTNGTNHMPVATQKVAPHLMQFQPNLDSYVFFKSHVNADIVIDNPTGEEEDVTIDAGARYVMRYRPVSHLLHSDRIELT